MSSHRYWRLTALEAYAGGEIEISEAQLLDGITRADSGATFTSSIAPLAGTLSNLTDNATSAVVRLDRLTVLNWDLGSAAEVNNILLGGGDSIGKFPLIAKLQWSDDNSAWTTEFIFSGIAWPGARTITGSSLPSDQTLLHFDGTNGSTTFTEVGGKTVTRVGGTLPTISTAQSKFGGASMILSNGGVSVPITARNGDFMDVIHFYWDGTGGTQSRCILHIPALEVYIAGSGGSSNLRVFGGGADQISTGAAGVPAANTWHTLMFLRQGSRISLILNGVDVGSGTWTAPIAAGTAFIGIFGSLIEPFKGYIDEYYSITDDITLQDLSVVPTAAFATLASYRINRNKVRGRAGAAVPIIVPTAASVPYAHGQVRTAGPVRGRNDYLTGVLGQGIGRVKGTTKDKGTPSNVPVSERVRLYREKDGLLIRELWSTPGTGAYSFDYVDELMAYTVISYDHDLNFRAVVADNLTLAGGGVELIA